MPTGCATWPAFWLCNQTNPFDPAVLNGTVQPWPAGGEIDILEGVHVNDKNSHTLHTSEGCQRKPKTDYGDNPPYTGTDTGNYDCKGESNSGCGIDGFSGSYGDTLNSQGGKTAEALSSRVCDALDAQADSM